MAKVNFDQDWQGKLLKLAAVRTAQQRLAASIAEEARDRTEVGTTGRARESVGVTLTKDGVYVTGGRGDGWYYLFQEVGGQGFRPPPMPIRRAASKYNRR